MTDAGEWILAVDFGTTNTVAAVSDVYGTQPLIVDGRPVMPSAVFLNLDGRTWSCGETAVRLARRRMEWFEANPKNWVPQGTLFLGGRDVPVGDAITAILRPICSEATLQHGGNAPAAYLVTHPADWGEARVRILLQAAAAAAGRHWPAPRPLPEPVAAAQGILSVAGAPQQARFAVLDLGGGTVDVSVVDRDGDTLTVAGQPIGRSGMGGEDYDQRLARWMVEEAGAPGLYDRLAASADPDERERAFEIRAHAREVKEELSRTPAVPALLPKSLPEFPEPTPVQVNRAQLEELIGGGPGHEPGLADAVDLVNMALRQTPPGPSFAGVFLTGGSARIPMLGRLVQQYTGLRPISYGDPTTTVARGAAEYGRKALVTEWEQGSQAGQEKPRQQHRIRQRTLILVAALVALLGGALVAVVLTVNNCSSMRTCGTTAGGLSPSGSAAPSGSDSALAPSDSAPAPSGSDSALAPSGPSLSSAEQDLVNQLDGNVLTNCTAASDQEGNGIVAAVNCQAVNSGPTEEPLIVQFSDVSTAESWFQSATSEFQNTNDCADGNYVGSWEQNSTTEGQLGCAYIGTDQFRMIWTISTDLIGAIADGSYGPDLYSWWTNNVFTG